MSKLTQIKDAAREAERAVSDARRYERLQNVKTYLEQHGRLSNCSVRFEASAVVHHDIAVTEVESLLHQWWQEPIWHPTGDGTAIEATLKQVLLSVIDDEMVAIERRML